MNKEELRSLIRETIKSSVNEEMQGSRRFIYLVMIGNNRGMGPYKVYADKVSAEAEAEKLKSESSMMSGPTRAFVQQIEFIG